MKVTKELLDFLGQCPLYRGLTPDELGSIIEIYEPMEFQANETVFQEGDEDDRFYFMLEGTVEILQKLTLKTGRTDFEEKDKTLVRLSAKDHAFFGEMALLGDGVRTATVRTIEKTTLLSLKMEAFLLVAKRSPRIGFLMCLSLAELLAKRLSKANKDILKLTTALSIALSR